MAHWRAAELHALVARRAARWTVADNAPNQDHRHGERRHERLGRSVRPVEQVRTWTTPDSFDAVADLGPSAREGRRMWVRVLTAGEVKVKPAVAIGGLSGRQASAGALNCWGQAVMLVGHGGNRWSREMVCDEKPASTNEWSAQIFYGGPAAR